MARNITLAFAGSGEVKAKTVEALLDDWLGFGPKDADGYPEPSDHEITVILPLSAAHMTDSLQAVIDWTEYADLPYVAVLAKGDRDASLEQAVEDAESVHEVANVNKKVIDLLSEAEGEKYLVLMWGEEGDEESETLLDLATVEGIVAKDLTAGLDDISFGDDEDEETPEPEPEPEPEKPARGRGRRGRQVEEPLEAQEEPLEEEPKAEEKPARGRGRKAAAPKAEEPVEESADKAEETKPESKNTLDNTQDPDYLEDLNPGSSTFDADYVNGVLHAALLHHQKQDEANALRNLDEPRESPMTTLLREALEHVTTGAPTALQEAAEDAVEAKEEPEPEAPKRGRGRPRVRPETEGYLVDEDGIHRKAGRGRPKKGEKRVELTADEVAKVRADGMLDED